MFEILITLPADNVLTITVIDYDYASADDLIGSTSIDLESCCLSHHSGLPESFSK